MLRAEPQQEAGKPDVQLAKPPGSPGKRLILEFFRRWKGISNLLNICYAEHLMDTLSCISPPQEEGIIQRIQMRIQWLEQWEWLLVQLLVIVSLPVSKARSHSSQRLAAKTICPEDIWENNVKRGEDKRWQSPKADTFPRVQAVYQGWGRERLALQSSPQATGVWQHSEQGKWGIGRVIVQAS